MEEQCRNEKFSICQFMSKWSKQDLHPAVTCGHHGPNTWPILGCPPKLRSRASGSDTCNANTRYLHCKARLYQPCHNACSADMLNHRMSPSQF